MEVIHTVCNFETQCSESDERKKEYEGLCRKKYQGLCRKNTRVSAEKTIKVFAERIQCQISHEKNLRKLRKLYCLLKSTLQNTDCITVSNKSREKPQRKRKTRKLFSSAHLHNTASLPLQKGLFYLSCSKPVDQSTMSEHAFTTSSIIQNWS